MRRSLFIRFYLFPQNLASRQTGILMFVRSERKAPSQPFSPILGPDPLRRAQPLFLPDLPPRSSPAGAARQPLSLANESADARPLPYPRRESLRRRRSLLEGVRLRLRRHSEKGHSSG